MYPAHGTDHLRVSGRRIVIDAYGPWNLEAAMEFDSKSRMIVAQHFANATWAMLIYIHADGIYTPEAIPVLRKLHRWRLENGLRRVAIVLESASGGDLTRSQLSEVYAVDESHLCDIRFFLDPAEAAGWLEAAGY